MPKSKWENEDVKVEEPPRTVVINRRPWVYIDLGSTDISLIKLVIILGLLVDLGLMVVTTLYLLGLLNTPQWPNAGLIYGGPLAGEVMVWFCMLVTYAFASGDMF